MKSWFLTMACTGAGLSVLALAYLALLPLLRRRYGPRGLYRVWLVLLVGLLIPFGLLAPRPLMTVTLPQALARPAVTQSAAPVYAVPETAEMQPAQPLRAETGVTAPAPRSAPVDWLSVLGYAWLAGAAAVLALATVSHVRFARTVRRWRTPCRAGDYAATLEACLADMNIRRRVELCLCPTVSSPMLMGLVHPVILLPDEELTADELALVLRHELTHLRRGDLLVKAALVLAYALHWYNPVIWAAGRSLCFYQEASCDSHVTARADAEERRFYSETILRVIRRQARARTALCTSFYGGRNGMKRRIWSIMEGRRRTGAALCACALALTVLCGGALAMIENDAAAERTDAWVHAVQGNGTILLSAPSANDYNVPMGIYLNGTPVTIVELCESSALPAWNCEEGQPNWACVLIAGDGETSGIMGWVPLRDLVYEKPLDALPTTALAAGEETGYTTLYTLNTRESDISLLARDGTDVTVLGQLDTWLHVTLDDQGMFMLLDDAALSDSAEGLLYDLLPDRFDSMTRVQYDNSRNYSRLLEAMQDKYAGAALEFWSLEDKAWYGQLEEQYLGSHDHYYILPGEGDLPLEQAQQIVLDAYAKALGRDSVSADEVDLYPGFYRQGYTEPVYWSFYLCFKDTHEVLWRVELDGKTGEILNATSPRSPEPNG